jgi:hypothetical protein
MRRGISHLPQPLKQALRGFGGVVVMSQSDGNMLSVGDEESIAAATALVRAEAAEGSAPRWPGEWRRTGW